MEWIPGDLMLKPHFLGGLPNRTARTQLARLQLASSSNTFRFAQCHIQTTDTLEIARGETERQRYYRVH